MFDPDVLLIVLYLLALLVYVLARPSWRNIGPSLLDSFVIGIALYAFGAVLVWLLTSITYASEIMRIALVAGISASLGSALWGRLFRARIRTMNFLAIARDLRAGSGDRFAITVGLVVSALVTLWFLVQVYSHEHIRALLYEAIVQGRATLTEARLLISSGAEGYFAPGYVKQFRDILIPILCAAALLSHGSFRGRSIFFGALVVAFVGMFVSGQRLLVVELALCIGGALVLALIAHGRSKLMPIGLAVPTFVVMAGAVLLMTQMLGRLDQPPTLAAGAAPQPGQTMHAPRPSPTKQPVEEKELKERSLARTIVATLVAMADRAVMAAPQENAFTYEYWAPQAPTWGAAWLTGFAGMRPGTQTQLSNELSRAKRSTRLGNSPLAIPADLYHNWGWVGVIVFCLVYPLLYLLFDMHLTGSRSPLLLAGKIFLFFSIPIIYTPFLFVLYGGAVVLALALYVELLRRGALAFLGLRDEPA